MRCTRWIGCSLLLVAVSCNWKPPQSDEGIVADTLLVTDSLAARSTPDSIKLDTLAALPFSDSSATDRSINKDTAFVIPGKSIDTKGASPANVVAFAKTLIGVRYVYGSTDPKIGFDCSGFITHVFRHFHIAVPRSSIDFTDVGQEIPKETARTGDLILFTGTNPLERHVGHMGLVTEATRDSLQFIHCTSGKAMGVTITPLNGYYMKRFVKVIRIF